MSATTASGYQYAVTGDPAEIHTVSQNLAESIEGRGVPAFASKTAALAAFGTTPAGSARPYVWIEDRQGHLYWTGTAWQWVPQRNQLVNMFRAGGDAVSTAGGSVGLHDPAPVTLPPGNRLIHVYMRADVINGSSAAGIPRLYDNGFGFLNVRGLVLGGSYQVTVGGWMPPFVYSGTLNLFLSGHDAQGATPLSWLSIYLKAYDLGPTDD